MRICFIGSKAIGQIYPDDALAAKALQNRGHSVDYLCWDDPAQTWDRHDIYINRCTWRYQYDYENFIAWLKERKKSGVALYNAADDQIWNIHKKYLKDFPDEIKIPSLFFNQDDLINAPDLVAEKGWQDIVYKPAVGASGFDTGRLKTSDIKAGLGALENIFGSGGPDQQVIIQPFIPEVLSEGEWSFVFYNGIFSHAVIKQATGSEFRVQERWGGTYLLKQPGQDQIAQVAATIERFGGSLLYARVDGFFQNGRFLLGELEICDPYLWFGIYPPSAETFADAVSNLSAHHGVKAHG